MGVDAISSTLSRNGNVLLPVDGAGRVLELLITLDQHWASIRPNAPLVLYACFPRFVYSTNYYLSLSQMAYNTVESARGHLEWMSDAIMKRFVGLRENAFAFRHVHILHDIEELKVRPIVHEDAC